MILDSNPISLDQVKDAVARLLNTKDGFLLRTHLRSVVQELLPADTEACAVRAHQERRRFAADLLRCWSESSLVSAGRDADPDERDDARYRAGRIVTQPGALRGVGSRVPASNNR